MKLFSVVTYFLLLITVLLPSSVSAHLAGQPPFFKINGQYSVLYPVPLTSLSDFNLPQDSATENYLVGQRLVFELDTNTLPAPKEVIDQTTFYWDFGDNTKSQGLTNTHAYTKQGSYILTIKAQYITDPEPQLLQSVLINILPNKEYQLPKAVITINGKTSKDPLTDTIKVDFKQPVTLDASTSQISQGKVVSYTWDIGNQQTSDKATFDYSYDPNLKIIFPVLRIKDSNGFIADSFVEIENDPGGAATQAKTDNPQTPSSSNSNMKFLMGGAVILIVLIGGGVWYKKRKPQNTKKEISLNTPKS